MPTLAAIDLANEPTTFVAKSWWREVLEVIATCGELGPEREVSYYHLTGSTPVCWSSGPSSSGPMATISAE